MKYALLPKILLASITTLLLLVAGPQVALSAHGEVFYVDAGNPSASDSNDGSESSPWRTIQKAASTLTAGETVIVKAGVYTDLYSGAPNSGVSAIKPQNSGTPEAPITFQAEPGKLVIIDQQNNGPGFYILKKNHIVISGFEIRNAKNAGIRTTDFAEGIIINNNNIHSISGSVGNNPGAIRINDCGYCRVEHNELYDAHAGVHSYDMHHTTISNNHIHNTDLGVFHKRSSGQKGAIVRNNTFRDINETAIWYSIGGTGNPGHKDQEVYENIFHNIPTGIKSTVWETGTVNDGLSIHNNVFNTKTAISLAGHQGVEIWDNIFLGNEHQIVTTHHSGGWDNRIDYSDHNLYDNSLSIIMERYGNEQRYTSLEAWQGAQNTSWVSGSPGVNSIVGESGCIDPLADNYRLLNTSIARDAGRYGDDIGAYPDGTTDIRPLPPTNITAQ